MIPLQDSDGLREILFLDVPKAAFVGGHGNDAEKDNGGAGRFFLGF